jgi:hypothetical protein
MKTKILSIVLFMLAAQTLFAAVPTITAFSPSSGAIGTLVTITGTNMSSPATFTIGGKPAIVISNTGTQLVGMVMPGSTAGGVSITNADGTATSSANFAVTPTLYPNIQQGNKLIGTNSVYSLEGSAVAVSADGTTAIVGAPFDNNAKGAVHIFVRSGNTWTEEAKLIGSSTTDQPLQGTSVAISADGNTVIFGGSTENAGKGAAWVFVRNSGAWTEQRKMTGNGSVGNSNEGHAVGLSADGNTAIIGGISDDNSQGAVWTFVRTGTHWVQLGVKIAGLGDSFAISADGKTLAIGFHGVNIYTLSGDTWIQQGVTLVGADNVLSGQTPKVALSADGNVLIAGNIANNGNIGGALMFTRSGSTWMQQGNTLIGSGSSGTTNAGGGVALSADGNTALISGYRDNGGIGATWIFTRTASTWAQQGVKLVGTNYIGTPNQGLGLALSANGAMALIGGPSDNTSQGATWVFNYNSNPPPAPVITSFSPSSGGIGTLVTIMGTNLGNPTEFSIGGKPAIVVSNTGSQLVGMVMPGAATGGISVTTANGNAIGASSFTVTPTLFPNLQQGDKLAGFGGWAVVVSTDGQTAAVGAPTRNNGQGGVFVFILSGGTWVQQGSVLAGTGGVGQSFMGAAVAISADGNTILGGAPDDNNNIGAAWVFTRSNGVWKQQGAKLTGIGFDGGALFGNSASLSADGNTAIIGAPYDNRQRGAVFIFNRLSGVWSQLGNKLVSNTGTNTAQQGCAVAISADGNTAVVGGQGDNNVDGAAWIYVKANGIWAQQGNKLFGSDKSGRTAFGSAAAISADGNTVALGGGGDASNQGAIWIFTRNGSLWEQQGSKLVETNNIGPAQFGFSVALSADGNTLAGGGFQDDSQQGAIWTFTRSGSSWLQKAKLKGTGSVGSTPQQGWSVALSADGTELIAGANSDDSGNGAVWTFIYSANPPQPPTIASFAPSSGAVGSLVTITGTNLNNPTTFKIGGVPAIVISNSGTQLVGMVMPGAATGAISFSTSEGTATVPGTFTVTPTLYPKVQMGAKLAATGNIQQGWSVAVSADGNTAIVGTRNDNNGIGAALIFVRNANTWTQQGPPLIGSGNVGNSGQGVSVAISADGNTALVGGNNDNNGQGAAWIFTRGGSLWTQRGAKLVGSDNTGAASQGESVSLSADGNTVVLGGPSDNSSRGAVWIFNRFGTSWFQYGAKLIGSGNTGGAALGNSVAISADGNTIIAGGESDNSAEGAAWIFVRNGNSWLQQGSKLVGTGGTGRTVQGLSVAINADGTTIIMGGPGDNTNQGAFWVFTRTGTTWAQQGQKLAGTGNIGAAQQGWTVALSADGNTAFEGGYADNNQQGASWAFTRSAGVWIQQGPKMVGTGATGGTPDQGRAVALSADGATGIEGGFGDNAGYGAAWTFIYGKYPQTITFTLSAPVIYGAADFATATSTNAIPITYSSSDTTIAKIVNNKIHVVGAGTAAITASQAGDADYAAATPVTQTLTVNKAPLTIAAKNTIGLINSPLPVLAIRYTGFVNGDTDSTLTTLPVTATTATASSPAGDYPITVSGAVSANYSFTYAPGTLTLSTTTNITVISSFNPVTGSPGRLVTVTGSRLNNLTGFTIGGVPAVVISNSGTKLVGMVMPGATTGGVTVTTASGSSTGPGVYAVIPTPHPMGQQGNKLTVTGSAGQPLFGTSVDVDAEGTTAVIGAPGDNGLQGAVYIFTRTGNLWTQQGGKLAGTGNIGAARQGSSVAISADGNTIIEGGEYDNNLEGAAWIFTRTNGIWSQQGGKLTGIGSAGTQPSLGNRVALSADGNTAVISRPNDNTGEGAVWVFSRSGGNWAQQGSKLVGTGNIQAASQGLALAISADGNTIAEGGPGDNSGKGALWVFTRNGSTWTQQGNKLVGTGNNGPAAQGSSVALSADGNILLAGGTHDNNQQGSIWTFQRNGAVWTQQGSKFSGVGSIGQAREGTSVALSADGMVATVGASLDDNGVGASWVFRSNGSSWVQQSAKRMGSGSVGKAVQGISVSISSNGKTALVGGPTDNNNQGAVWIYSAINTQAPVIASISPASGPVGTLVTITGTNFNNARFLKIGDTPAILISSADNLVTAMVMPGSVNGPVSLIADGGTASSNSNFTVTPTPTPTTQQGDKLLGTGSTGNAAQGISVAISADGNTAIVGANKDNNNQGAAWIFVKNGENWVQQGAKLVGTGNIGASAQGTSVAINADGNTVVVGGATDNNNQGAAWVFTRSNNTWVQQARLVGTGYSGAAYQGRSVAISADGNTIVMSGDLSSPGSVWVFTRSMGTWSQQGSKLTASGPVAISADGNTLIAAGGSYDSFKVFILIGGYWAQQWQGLGSVRSVALSADGNVAVFGETVNSSPYDPDDHYPPVISGQAYVFNRTGSKWVFRHFQNTGYSNEWGFDMKVAISADGSTFLVGANMNSSPGVLVFGSNAPDNYLRVSNAVSDLALSADGTTAIVGTAFEDNQGAVRFFTSSSQALQAITFAPPGEVTYGAADVIPNVVSTNTSLPIMYSSSNTKVATIVNNKIHITGAGNTNITASQGKTITAMQPFTVNKALLTIAADNQIKKQVIKNRTGKLADVQPLTVKYNGFVYNDDVAKFTAKPIVTTTADDNSPAGTYPITISGAAADNYTFNYIPGTLTVNIFEDLLTDITKRIIPYPNPSQTVIKLDLGADNIRDVTIEISAVSDGRKVYSKKYANSSGVVTIDASSFRGGVYALKLACNQWQRVYKVWKK